MKKIFILSIVLLFLPFLTNAATLNNTFNVGTLFPALGTTMSVSSTCGVSAGNGNVSFVLAQNGNHTQLSTNLSTDSNGAFSGNIVFPSSINSSINFSSAILIATCSQTGDTINSPVLIFAMPASTSFGLPATSPTVGGIYNLSGACGYSNGVGNVQITLNQNGNNFTLGTVNLSPNGTFSSNVVIPNNISTGSATLKATCSNQTTFFSNLNFGPIAVNSFAFSSNPLPGSYTTISGNCTNVSNNANGSVSFSVLRSGTISSLSATSNQTNATGYFSSLVFFPSNVGSNPATLVVTCPNSSTFSNVIILGIVLPTAPVVPAVLGENTPVGGVAAGFGPQNSFNYLVIGILMFAGSFVLFALTRKNFYVQK